MKIVRQTDVGQYLQEILTKKSDLNEDNQINRCRTIFTGNLDNLQEILTKKCDLNEDRQMSDNIKGNLEKKAISMKIDGQMSDNIYTKS